jgi:hypothetical protein
MNDYGISGLPLCRPKILPDEWVAFATDGRLRDIRRLLVRAVELAYEQPDPRLTDMVLAEAFRTVIYRGSPDKRNPFHKAFNELPLVEGDEPFAPVGR